MHLTGDWRAKPPFLMLAYPGLLCQSLGPWGATFSSSDACPSPLLLTSLLCREVKQQQTFSRGVKNIFCH